MTSHGLGNLPAVVHGLSQGVPVVHGSWSRYVVDDLVSKCSFQSLPEEIAEGVVFVDSGFVGKEFEALNEFCNGHVALFEVFQVSDCLGRFVLGDKRCMETIHKVHKCVCVQNVFVQILGCKQLRCATAAS